MTELFWGCLISGSFAKCTNTPTGYLLKPGRLDNWPHRKIGYTNNPEQRIRDYRRNGWHEMWPLYETESLEFARDMEEYLIHHIRQTKQAGYRNYVGGRNGRFAANAESYFTYIVLAERYARILE